MAEIGSSTVPEDQALALVRALDGPLNFLDTAAGYGDGESERRIGLVLRERGGPPDGFVLATKADRNLQTHDFSGDQARRSVERSLQLLGLDRLQLVYLHDPEFAVQTLRGDHRARRRGRGAARPPATGRHRAGRRRQRAHRPGDPLRRDRRLRGRDHPQPLHAAQRGAEPLFRVAAARDVAVVNAAPYGGGMLAKGPRADPRYMYRPASGAFLERAQRMADACARYDVPLAAAALQFSLREPRITSTIVGFSHAARLPRSLELAALPIPDALWAELDAIAAG